jgi:hypothetical protein
LTAHHAVGHASLEVQFEELGLFVFECLEASAVPGGRSLDDPDVLCGYRLDRSADLSDGLLGEFERPIERGDLDLNFVDSVVPGFAGSAVAGSASNAAEVFVEAAGPSVLAVDQAGSAVGACQAALEVVQVTARAVPGRALGVESRLYAVKDRSVDELGVSPLDCLSHVDDRPDVVRVAKQRVDAVAG